MNHNMQKVIFTEFAEIKQGDGLGPKFEAGKAYWLSVDQAERWKAEGIAEDAADEVAAENEPALTLRPHHIRITRASHNRYNVIGPGDMKHNDAPLSPRNAELLRKRMIEEGSVPTIEETSVPKSADNYLSGPVGPKGARGIDGPIPEPDIGEPEGDELTEEEPGQW